MTIKTAYFPKDNSAYFNSDLSITDWLRQYSPENQDDVYIRSFLGRMLFSGEESLKKVRVLSGGNSHDHQFVNTVANRIIELTPTGVIDRMTTLDDYLADDAVRGLRDKMYRNRHNALSI